MLPLIRMTWTLNRRLLIQFSPFLAFYLYILLMAQGESNWSYFASILVFFAALITGILALQGLTASVEGFLLSLPVSRSQVVRAKYLTSLLGLAAGLGLPLLTAWIAHHLAPSHFSFTGRDIPGIAGLAGIVLAFGICCFLPFLFALGSSKGFLSFAMTLLILLTGWVGWLGVDGCMEVALAFSQRFLESPRFAASVLAGLTLFGAASMAFSIWRYQHRES